MTPTGSLSSGQPGRMPLPKSARSCTRWTRRGGLLRLRPRGAGGVLSLCALRPRDGAPEPAAIARTCATRPRSVNLQTFIGTPVGTCTLEDFDHCDAIFFFGQNTGTNSPRFLHVLEGGGGAGLPDRDLQSGARARPDRVRRPAEHQADDRRQTDADLREILSGAARRGHRGDGGTDEMRARGRRRTRRAPCWITDFIAQDTTGFDETIRPSRDATWARYRAALGPDRAR